MLTALHTDEFLERAKKFPVFDVRTPAEFEKGRIPGAINLPLFTNEERAIVGTLYKQKGRQPAIVKGLELVGPKMANLVTEAQKHAVDHTVMVHCWRGGMRSGSVAWLLSMYGLNVYTLKGGYKFFRRKMLDTFEKPYLFHVIGGKTGSSKSKVIHFLKEKKLQVIDLEGMAHHKGSSYGHLGEEPQPRQEMFENLLGMALLSCDASKKIILEDESRQVGINNLPSAFFEKMRMCPVLYLDVPFEKRASYLAVEYGKFEPQKLIEATQRITKRLGPQQTKTACEAIAQNRMEEACRIILAYYDKAYDYGLSLRDPSTITRMPVDDYTEKNLDLILQAVLS